LVSVPIDEDTGIGEGARIELRKQQVWLHEQHEIGVGRFGPIRSRRVRSVNEAVRLYIRANGGSPIDGIHVDWNG
jgi:hypothetical protein